MQLKSFQSLPKISESAKNPGDQFIGDLKATLGDFYDSSQDSNIRINLVLDRLDKFFSNFDKNIVSQEQILEIKKNLSLLSEAREIQSKSDFIKNIIKILEPVLYIREKYPKEFEEAQSVANNRSMGYIELNRLVTYEKAGDTIKIHHSQARTIGPSLRLYYDAMGKLAKIVKADPEIQKVEAVSWIVRHSPGLFTKKGFVVEDLDEKDEDKDISMAYISRDKFLEVFGANLEKH